MEPSPLCRSYLYVPGFDARRIDGALHSEADAVVLDLEDAVPPSRKQEARDVVAGVIAQTLPKPVFVRVNSLASGLAEEDVTALRGPGLSGIRLPKAEHGEAVRQVARWLAEAAGGRGDVGVVPLVESALGVERAFDLACADPAVRALAMGEADLRADLRASGDEGLAYARSRCVNAAAAAGLVAIQSVFTDLSDLDGLRASTERGRLLGFLGRSAVHPVQVAVIHDALTPSDDERRRAEAVIATAEEGWRHGSGVAVTADGRFVDQAVVRSARITLALAARGQSGTSGPAAKTTG